MSVMEEKRCIICNEPISKARIQVHGIRVKTCSTEHAIEYLRRRNGCTAAAKKPRLKGQKNCTVCGEPIPIERRRKYGKRARTCSPEHSKINIKNLQRRSKTTRRKEGAKD